MRVLYGGAAGAWLPEGVLEGVEGAEETSSTTLDPVDSFDPLEHLGDLPHD